MMKAMSYFTHDRTQHTRPAIPRMETIPASRLRGGEGGLFATLVENRAKSMTDRAEFN